MLEPGNNDELPPIPGKRYFTIGEVSDLCGVKPHVLRYWETQFDILRPTKNRAGNRVYRPKDIELVLLVKNLLYEQKYTIEGANQKLLDMRREGELEDGQQEIVGPEFLASMKKELEDLSKRYGDERKTTIIRSLGRAESLATWAIVNRDIQPQRLRQRRDLVRVGERSAS